MLLNFFLEKIILPLGDFITGYSFIKSLKYWRSIDILSEQELVTLQEEKLKNILNFAVNNTTYYKDYKQFKDDDLQSWLKSFPILTKDILKASSKELLSESKKKLHKISSSGSTGISSSVFMNKNDLSILQAGSIHWWEWSGYKIGTPLIQTGISTNRGFLKSIKDFLFRTTYISAFAHSESQLLKVLKNLGKREYVLVGYASSLNIMANVAKKHNIKVKFLTIISLGDKLFNHYRKNIEVTFKTKVKDTYGSSEGFLIAAESDIKYYYILSPQVYLEILDDEGNEVADGEMGNIVVTRLDGFAMPLIRYRLGDLGIKLPKEKYPIKRRFNYPLMEQIIGRETDVVKTNNGKILIVHSFTGIFEHIPEIRQFKIVQENLNGITIIFVKGENYTNKILAEITLKILNIVEDNAFKIIYKEVDIIHPTNSGKPQIIESKLK